MEFHPPTQETVALAVEECATPSTDFPTYSYLASADFAGGRMTRRSPVCCVPNRFSARRRSRVPLLETTGLPVMLHFGKKEMLHIADPKDIKDGKMTDVYFVRTMQVLKAKKIDKRVKAGFIAKRFPEDYGELNLRGFHHVKIFVSGGLDENRILALNPLVDAYGVGTSITNARVIDFAMDIIEIGGKPLAKRGKMSGSKSVLRCSKCFQDRISPYGESQGRPNEGANRCSCGGRSKELLLPFIQDRRILWDLPKPQAIREYVLEQLPHFDF